MQNKYSSLKRITAAIAAVALSASTVYSASTASAAEIDCTAGCEVGTGVTATYDGETNTLNVIGTGTLDRYKFMPVFQYYRSYYKQNVGTASVVLDGENSVISLPADSREFFKDTGSNVKLPANLDVSNVTNMAEIFANSSVDADLSQWNTSNVTDMSRMFYDSYMNPDLSKWNTSKVTTMKEMFYGANSMKYMSIGNWDTGKVEDMSSMFARTSQLIPDTSNWNTSNVKNMNSMFYGACKANPDVSRWNTGKVMDMSHMFQNYDCSYNTVATPDTTNWDTSNVENMSYMFSGAVKATPNTTNWNTSKVMDMSYMFDGASIANPDTSKWNTSKVTNMNSMFRGATRAETNTAGWDTSKVTDMSSMFAGATLATPDTTNWNTGSVTDMSSMFSDAINAAPNTTNWDTSVVRNMSYMFNGAKAANPDTSNWDTFLVTNMAYMFHDAVKAAPNTSNWFTNNVTSMESMFENAASANPDTSEWETGNVYDMDNMFKGAVRANPDVSHWNVNKAYYMQYMFADTKIADPDVSKWILYNNGNLYLQGMFNNARVANPDVRGWTTVLERIENGGSVYTTDMFCSARNATYWYDTAFAKRAPDIACGFTPPTPEPQPTPQISTVELTVPATAKGSFTVKGLTKDAEGKPVAGTVKITYGQQKFDRTTDAKGEFFVTFAYTPDTKIVVTVDGKTVAEQNGPAPATTTDPEPEPEPQPTPQITTVDLTVPATAKDNFTVHGVAKDAEGKPVAGTIKVTYGEQQIERNVGANGEFSIDLTFVPDARIIVTANNNTVAEYAGPAAEPTPEPEPEPEPEPQPAPQITTVQLTVPATAKDNFTVRGVAKDTEGKPVAGTVKITYGQQQVDRTVGANGEFSVDLTFVANAKIVVISDGRTVAEQNGPAAEPQKKIASVQLTVPATAKDSFTVRGIAKNADGKAIAGNVTVAYGRQLIERTTNNKGEFSVELIFTPNTKITVTADGKKVAEQNGPAAETTPEPQPTPQVASVELVVPETAANSFTVTGTAKDTTGAKAAKRALTVAYGRQIINVTTGNNGEFSVDLAFAPNTKIVVTAEGKKVAEYAGPAAEPTPEPEPEPQPQPAAQVAKVEVEVPKTAAGAFTITGVAKDAEGNAVADRNITVAYGRQIVNITTDANGAFTIDLVFQPNSQIITTVDGKKVAEYAGPVAQTEAEKPASNQDYSGTTPTERLTVSHQNRDLAAGDTTILRAAIQNPNDYTITWYKDGLVLEGATSPILAVVATDEAVNYKYVAVPNSGTLTPIIGSAVVKAGKQSETTNQTPSNPINNVPGPESGGFNWLYVVLGIVLVVLMALGVGATTVGFAALA